MMIKIKTLRLEFPAVIMLIGPKISAEMCLKILEYFGFATLTSVLCIGDLNVFHLIKSYVMFSPQSYFRRIIINSIKP